MKPATEREPNNTIHLPASQSTSQRKNSGTEGSNSFVSNVARPNHHQRQRSEEQASSHNSSCSGTETPSHPPTSYEDEVCWLLRRSKASALEDATGQNPFFSQADTSTSAPNQAREIISTYCETQKAKKTQALFHSDGF